MRLRKKLLSVLLVLVMLFALTLNAFAVNYTPEPGLSGIQPQDTLTLPEDTDWASLIATWGVRVIFLDWRDNEISSVLVPEGGSAHTPNPPVRQGYTFTGWSRIDSAGGSASLNGEAVNNVYGPGPLVYKANYLGVLADGQTSGTITVLNTTHGNAYAGYKIFDAEINSGNVDAIIYTITEDSPWYEFVQEYFDLSELREEGEGEEAKTIYKVDPKEGFDPKTFFEDLPTSGITPNLPEQTPTSDGVITWDEVPFGYYAITSSLGSWVTVHTNNPFATVIDKNQGPQLDKNIVEADDSKTKVNDASFGDSVLFDIEVKASNYKANELITYYHITDTISDGFDYDFTDSSNVAVTVTGTQAPVTTQRLTEVNSLAELQAASSGYVFLYNENSRSFEVIVKWAALNSDGKQMPINADEWNYIDVTYSATVNNNAVIAGNGNPNTASFSYDKSSGFDPENPPTEEPTIGGNPESGSTVSTTTYVHALAIEKVDAADNSKHLAGVRFTTDNFKATMISDGIYEVIGSGDTTSEAAEYFEVPESGFILIKGLGAGEYTFQETYALPGYNLLPKDGCQITIASGSASVGQVSGVDCAQISRIENSTGIELPSTGGFGTTIFLTCGSILVFVTGVLLVTKKRMANGEQ